MRSGARRLSCDGALFRRRLEDDGLGRRVRKQPRHVLEAQTAATVRRGGSEDAIELLYLPQPAERMGWAASLLDPGVNRDAGAKGRVLDRLEKRQRDGHLVAERRVLCVAERDEQEVRGNEGRALRMGEPDRCVEDRGVEVGSGERDEDSRSPGAGPPQPEPAAGDERRREAYGESGEGDDGRDHSDSRSLSARFAITRMSRPGSSRTMRERSDPPKISRRRDSSGVPTKMYVEPRWAATRRTTATRSSPSSSRKCAPRIPASRRRAASWVASSSVGGRPGGRTQTASISVPRRCAERQARRMMRCDFGCGSTSARTRSATACWLSGSSGRAVRRASTSSATSRSTSSRRTASLSARKKFSSATAAC